MFARPALCPTIDNVVEPDVIGTEDRPPSGSTGWVRPTTALTALAALGLGLLALRGDAAALEEPPGSARSAARPSSTHPVPDPVVGSGCTGLHPDGGSLTYRFLLENPSRRPLVVIAVGSLGPGLRLVGTRVAGGRAGRAPPFQPFRLLPRQSRLLQLQFRVDDCAAARVSSRLPVTVATTAADGSRRRSQAELPVTASTGS